jgi:general secretion pathway protein G
MTGMTMKAWAALFLLLAQGKPDDPTAEAILNTLRARVEQARSIRAYSRSLVTPAGGGETTELVAGFRLKGKDRWLWEYDWKGLAGGGTPRRMLIQCDGRKIASEGVKDPSLLADLQPAQVAAELRLSLSMAIPSSLAWVPAGLRTPSRPARMTAIKDLGRDRVGDREVRVIGYTLQLSGTEFDGEVQVKVVVDPADYRILKRDIVIAGAKHQQTFEVFALDEEMPDSDFSWQSNRRLARVEVAQLGEAAGLFALCTGRHPGSLQDLVRRPPTLEADVFWPPGGFVLGGELPKDPWGHPFQLVTRNGRPSIVSLGADGKEGGKGDDEDAVYELPQASHRALGAPTERLAKYFRARLEAALLAGAVRAYRDAYGELPRKKAALWERAPWMEIWPDGGWLPGGKVPADPWGDPYRIISDEGSVRVQLRDPKAAFIGVKALTAEELRQLEEIGRPRISDAEQAALSRLFDRLGDDDSKERDRAHVELKSWGAAILPILEERLTVEKDREIAYRLSTLRKGIPARKPTWMTELGIIRISIGRPSLAPGQSIGDERLAAAALKSLTSAQADFRANDRDNNHVNDFWTGDVAGLYTMVPRGSKQMIKLIELDLAAADGAPLDEEALAKLAERQPKAGYWFRAMQKDNSQNPPAEYLQATTPGGAKTYNTSMFGFVAYPAEYGVTGVRTYIVNENNTLFWKDTQGEAVLEWPDDITLRQEWSKSD